MAPRALTGVPRRLKCRLANRWHSAAATSRWRLGWNLPPDGANLHGDILSKFDPATRTGLNFGTLNYAGVTAAQAHHRNLHFGIDDGLQEPSWVDCGRPGNNLRVYSLAVYNGDLYTGTFEWGADESGHMYRYAGGHAWEDCGSPDPCNTVASLAVYKGELYGGVSRYKAGGSALEDSPNKHPGGAIYRYTGDATWEYCGRLEGADSIAGMAVYNGELYAIPLYSQGVFRYAGGQEWEYCGTPGRRMMSITVFKGHLYGAGNEGGGVFRYDGGTQWTPCGFQEGVTQVYSFAAYQGRALRRHLAQRHRLPLGRQGNVGERGPLGRREGSDGNGGLQRQALRGDVASGKRLSLRGWRHLDQYGPIGHHAGREIPAGVVDGNF